MAENRVIGRHNTLPWRLPADTKFFKALTTGHTIVMGRKTFESMGRPLSNRRNVIITRDPDYRQAGATVVHSLQEAFALAEQDEEIFVVGGGDIYRLALPHADRLYLTVVHTEIDGDVFFPECDLSEWTLVEEIRHEADTDHAYAFTIRRYDR